MTAKRQRPKVLPGITYEMMTHCGKIYITITHDSSGRMFELFARFGRAGGCGAAVFDGLTKVVSYALRSGMDPEEAIRAFSGISCHHGHQTCVNAVADAMREFIDNINNYR